MFGFGKKKDKGASGKSDQVIGWFRVETAKLLGCDVNSTQFEQAQQSANEHIKSALLPALTDKKTMQEAYDTLASVCPSRIDEAFGEFMHLLWTRVAVIQQEVMAGRVKQEEATPNILAGVLSIQLKKIVKQL
ncbi:hypothetical protein GPB2148_1331 [marine gamma proteobacterium HTCC2148]|nr:hypothetical protein GPB2148_1331 [marine gamma proteobacterium HTCC2148]